MPHSSDSGNLITQCEEDIPAPKFETLGAFECLLEQAFDGAITAANDEAVARYLSGATGKNWTNSRTGTNRVHHCTTRTHWGEFE